jgi:hypothetical protein
MSHGSKNLNKTSNINIRVSKQVHDRIKYWSERHGEKVGPFCLSVIMQYCLRLELSEEKRELVKTKKNPPPFVPLAELEDPDEEK